MLGFVKMSQEAISVNNTNEITAFVKPFDIPYIRAIYIAMFSAIFLCCILGNVSVIYIILSQKRMRNVTNFFLINLAVSDLCVGIFCILPNLSTYLSTVWYLGRAMCKLYYFIQCTSYTASVLILTVISLERYFAIIHPMLNRRLTRISLLRTILIGVWMCASIYGIPNLIAYDIISVQDDATNSSTDFCVSAGQWNINMEVYSIVNFVLLYAVPLVLVSVMYSRISVVLWKSSQATSRSEVLLKPPTTKRASVNTYQPRCKKCGKDYIELKPMTSSMRRGGSKKISFDRSADKKIGNNCFKSHSEWAEPVDSENDETRNCVCTSKQDHSNRLENSRFTPKQTNKSSSRRTPHALITRRKVIRLLICIIVSFALCVLPHHVRILWQNWSPPQDTLNFGHMLIPPSTFLFFYLNSALNPLLYALLSDHFRRAFTELLPAICRRKNAESQATNFHQSRVKTMSTDVTQLPNRTLSTNVKSIMKEYPSRENV